MSTIASPRPSIALSSRRTSTSTERSTSVNPPTGSLRRGNKDRSALRDYYNLPKPSTTDTAALPTLDAEQESELDRADFNADAYVEGLLAREGLEGVVRVEGSLVSEIRSLDGEKKALVYDNYSKLIAATDTIRAMREKMDPGTRTKTLVADIEHIGETAGRLRTDLRKSHGTTSRGDAGSRGSSGERKDRERERETVRWVLGAPVRLEKMVEGGKRDEAETEWRTVEGLLEKWQGVDGVERIRQGCRKALEGEGG